MSWIQDPGHGGRDSGASANGQVEKEWTLEAGLYVNERLREHGISSVLTRSEDLTLESSTRVKLVKGLGRTSCISHHFNAGGGEGAEFIHSIYADGRFEHLLKEEFAKAGMSTRRIFSRKNTSGSDYYFMHRETGKVRTTIIEYGFLDSEDYLKLKEADFRRSLYESVVRAICRNDEIYYQEVISLKQDLFKVQLGAFTSLENAQVLAKELEGKGYNAFITK